MPTSETVEALGQASRGLCYQSEADAPWRAFRWPSAEGEPSSDEVRRRGRHKADAPAVEQSIDEFFGPLGQDQDWYGEEERATAAKYRALLDAVQQHLTHAKVVRVGERQVAVYVVGRAKGGGWAGLKTTAVET